MTKHTFTMTEDQATRVFALVESHTHALKNWIASRVEDGDFDRAKELVRELRQHQDLFRAFNMQAKNDIAAFRGIEVEVSHTV